MRCKIRLIALAFALMYAGCAKEAPQDIQTLKSSAARQSPANVPQADLATLVAGNNGFAFDLYRHIAVPGSNVFCSPYSISLALAMTWAGAERGDRYADGAGDALCVDAG